MPSLKRKRQQEAATSTDDGIPSQPCLEKSPNLTQNAFQELRPLQTNRHPQAHTIHSVQTSPLRRSPRRHPTLRHTVVNPGKTPFSLTSPVRSPPHRKNKKDTLKDGILTGKKSQFTTALSQAALAQEEVKGRLNSSKRSKADQGKQRSISYELFSGC